MTAQTPVTHARNRDDRMRFSHGLSLSLLAISNTPTTITKIMPIAAA
ncbi:MAG: hypothetical protein ACLT4Y_11475 [Bifidobacterium breve]